jgi:hypothetical protein
VEALHSEEGLTILRRLVAYSEKVFDFSRTVVAAIVDRRLEPRIPTRGRRQVGRGHVLVPHGQPQCSEQTAHSSFFRRWLGQPVSSADSIGRVNALINAEGLRQGIHHIYDRLKRNKALPDNQGIAVAVVDGHESHASLRRFRKLSQQCSVKVTRLKRQWLAQLLPGA